MKKQRLIDQQHSFEVAQLEEQYSSSLLVNQSSQQFQQHQHEGANPELTHRDQAELESSSTEGTVLKEVSAGKEKTEAAPSKGAMFAQMKKSQELIVRKDFKPKKEEKEKGVRTSPVKGLKIVKKDSRASSPQNDGKKEEKTQPSSPKKETAPSKGSAARKDSSHTDRITAKDSSLKDFKYKEGTGHSKDAAK